MATRRRQLDFFKVPEKQFGGSLLKGNPRGKRPFTTKNALHVILKSKFALRDWSFIHKANKSKIDYCLRRQAKNNGIRIYGLQIMSNHIHLNLLFPSRGAYISYVRAVSGIIPRLVMGCERGRRAIIEQFWEARPFTSIINWGRHFEIVKRYFSLNKLEALGFTRPYARKILESG